MVFAALIFVAAAFPSWAQKSSPDRTSWFAQGSILVFLENNALAGDLMPILPSLGFGFSFPFASTLRFEPTLDLYSTYYGFSDDLNRPVPLANQNRVAQVTGILFGFQVVKPFALTPKTTIRTYGGLATDIRIVSVASGVNEKRISLEEADRQTSLVREYFWGQGRWLVPLTGMGMDFTLNTGLRIGFDIRVWMPAYRLWTGEKLPTVEGWRFGVGLRINFD